MTEAMVRGTGSAVGDDSDDMGDAPLYAVIYRVLRDHIVSGAFADGLVLGESAVARAFGSSRVPAAAALRRLGDEGWLRAFPGRGLFVNNSGASSPLRLDLFAAGLRIPDSLRHTLAIRSRKERVYLAIERQVARCLPFGRFRLNESVMATTYRVSRTVAHEVLVRLERAGLIAQSANRRWYAGPLTREAVRDHFEMRWLLEPAALRQSVGTLSEDVLLVRRARVQAAYGLRLNSRIVEEMEHDLHVDTVLQCPNRQMREALRRSQLPLFATHAGFRRYRDDPEMKMLLIEHEEIYQNLIDGKLEAAVAALESHLKRSAQLTQDHIDRIGTLPAAQRVPFLIKIEEF